MSKLVESVAKELCISKGIDGFTSGDLYELHEIYEECIKRGMKPVHNSHPSNVIQRIRNGMRTGFYFNITVIPSFFGRKACIYQLKKNGDSNNGI